MTGTMLAVEVLELLKRSGRSLAVAESLTGGLLAAEIVDVPGASAVFRGGIVAYATDLKSTLLGVDPGLLKARGPVDPEVAGQMAAGIRHRMGADVGVSTTGVAGPDPQNGRVPGTVFIAVDVCGRLSRVQALAVPGDRGAVRAATVRAALALLGDVLTGTDADADAGTAEGTAEGTGADTGTREQG